MKETVPVGANDHDRPTPLILKARCKSNLRKVESSSRIEEDSVRGVPS